MKQTETILISITSVLDHPELQTRTDRLESALKALLGYVTARRTPDGTYNGPTDLDFGPFIVQIKDFEPPRAAYETDNMVPMALQLRDEAPVSDGVLRIPKPEVPPYKPVTEEEQLAAEFREGGFDEHIVNVPDFPLGSNNDDEIETWINEIIYPS